MTATILAQRAATSRLCPPPSFAIKTVSDRASVESPSRCPRLACIEILSLFFFKDPATTEIYTLSLHDALPISVIPAVEGRELLAPKPVHLRPILPLAARGDHGTTQSGVGEADTKPHRDVSAGERRVVADRSEEHTSELQSQSNLVCRLLLEKKK